ncbi:diphosphomevalonate/mevalonate 3,5-bisphosphate decarboxylase family protein [Luteirhabdus pelagi]|uniref:diphosphomevalonate/mevalonate 3,5-bisphosphate decarboxylase family protein n=1 Tax=Luteirhabdus pelagi TaxID=2792783 RepID=UPI0019394A9E|nr:diphosphomevalonate decarboxylase [Luteirhabdus pelagi]
MTEDQFLPTETYSSQLEGSVSVQSPSNIALVKYWGKYGDQLPKNASISFTLSNCRTKTTLKYKPKSSENAVFEVYLDKTLAPDFKPKIEQFFARIERYIPLVKEYDFIIETTNSFPHSSGIASSASGMSALAMCMMELEQKLLSKPISNEDALQKASFLARLGSGSAARSIEGPLVVWGEHSKIEGSSNLVGTQYPYEVHPFFQDYQDTILLVETGEKQVSSTVGHNLMHDHPFSEQRFQQANDNLSKLISILKEGTIEAFINIVESEALSLHAMMMTSNPYFILMKPNTLEIINRIWKYRRETGSNVCFTLDAGANVHVLYPKKEKDTVLAFIKEELAIFCMDGSFIEDQTGMGATLL